jgi:hypothetical protein
MAHHIKFLKVSSVAVKIAAWAFLLLGLLGAAPLILGRIPERPRLLGVVILLMYGFIFFFLYFVAKIADTLVGLEARSAGTEKE